MIPSFMDESRTPPGERSVFNLLSGGHDGWAAVHSLDLAPWNNRLRTEIDFLLIVPNTGILCIEVKSHKGITFDGRFWHPKSIKRSPFKQATDGRYTFQRRLREAVPRLSRVPVVHCCIFTHSRFELSENISILPWELMDRVNFNAFKSGKLFCDDLRSRMINLIEADPSIPTLQHPLSKDDVDTIVKFCVPIQKFRPDSMEEIRHREKEIEGILLSQQKPVLKLAHENKQVIVTGAAGTGKTLIAMNLALKKAEDGHRVALICFNQQVGDWMGRHIIPESKCPPNLVVGRAIQLIARMAGLIIPENASPEYWNSELPKMAQEKLTDPEFRTSAEFDYLIVDEAQDLLGRPELWDCLSLLFEGGWQNGSYTILGDFKNQILTDSNVLEQRFSAFRGESKGTVWELDENCRNHEVVGETAVSLTGFGRKIYSGYLRKGGSSENFDVYFFKDFEDQKIILKQYLSEFKKRGFSPNDITLLSGCAPESSVSASLKKDGFKLRPYRFTSSGYCGYSSIHAFKGMENKIIILTDLSLRDPSFHRHLFYIGMTRSTEFVRVLCVEDSKKMILSWL